MSAVKTVSIVIPFYNQENTVEMVVSAALNLNYPKEKLDIILVDDGSTDSTGKKIGQMNDDRLTKILLDKNAGRARARNLGLQKVRGEITGLLDGDMVVDPNWLTNLLKALDEKNVVAAMGESQIHPNLEKTKLDRYFYSFWRGARKHGKHSPIPFHRFLFNNTIVKTEALKKAGHFDESFRGYGGEDTDLAVRLWKLYPVSLRFVPEARSYHYHIRTLEEFCNDMRWFGEKNLPVLVKRYPAYKKNLGAGWAASRTGVFVFNQMFRTVCEIGYKFTGMTLFTRYLVAYAVVSGYRSR